jgi:hypothetical protein
MEFSSKTLFRLPRTPGFRGTQFRKHWLTCWYPRPVCQFVPWHRRHNVAGELTAIRSKGMDWWIHVTVERDHSEWTLINTVMSLRFPQNLRNKLTSGATVAFSILALPKESVCVC